MGFKDYLSAKYGTGAGNGAPASEQKNTFANYLKEKYPQSAVSTSATAKSATVDNLPTASAKSSESPQINTGLIEQYESTPNYNAVERLFDKNKQNVYKAKQELTDDYWAEKNKETAQKLSAAGITESDVNKMVSVDKKLSNAVTLPLKALANNATLRKAGITPEQFGEYTKGAVEDATRKTAKENPVVSTLLTYAANPLESGANLAQKAISYVTGKPMTNEVGITENVRNAVSEDMGKTGQFIYGVGNSIADMGVGALTGAAPLLLGAEKASSTANSAVERGLTPTKVLIESLASGATTAITEKLPFEQLGALASGTFKGGKNILKAVVKSAVAEGGQEMSEDVLDRIVDNLIAGDKSDRASEIQNYVNQGMSQTDAQSRVAGDFVKQTLLDGLAGAISGSALAGAGAIIGSTKNNAKTETTSETENIIKNPEPIIENPENVITGPTQLEQEQNARQNARTVSVNESGVAPTENVAPELTETAKTYSRTELSDTFKDARKAINDHFNMYGTEADVSDALGIESGRKGSEIKANLIEAMNEYADVQSPESYEKLRAITDEAERHFRGKVYTKAPQYTKTGKLKQGKNAEKRSTITYPGSKWGTITDIVMGRADTLAERTANEGRANNVGDLNIDPQPFVDYLKKADSQEKYDLYEKYKADLKNYVETGNEQYLSDAINDYTELVKGEDYESADFAPLYYAIENDIDNVVEMVENANSEVMNEDIGIAPTAQSAQTTQAEPSIPILTLEGKTSQTAENTFTNSKTFTKTKESMKYLRDAKKSGNFIVDVISERQSLDRAAELLDSDYEGEVERIKSTPQIDGVQLDESMMILDNLVDKAVENGDWESVDEWSTLMNQKIHKAAQGLQALAKYTRTASSTIIKTKKIIESAIKKMPKNRQNAANKLATALSNIYGSTKENVSTPKTYEDIRNSVVNVLSSKQESASVFNGFTDTDVDYIARMIEKNASTEYIQAKLQERLLTGYWGISNEDLQAIVNLFDEASKLDPNSKAAAELEEQAYAIAAKYLGSKTFMEKWNAWRYLAMLGNTRTHIRNIVGNTLFGTVTNIKDDLAAILETAVDKVSKTGIERTKAILTEADADLVKRASEDFDNSVYVYATDGDKYSMENAIKKQQKTFNSKLLEAINELNSNALTAEDNFAIKKKYKRSLASFLKANGKDASIFDSADPADMELLDRAREYAVNEAKIATFHEDNKVADVLNAWSKTAQEGGAVGKVLEFGLESVMPFKKTPANILKQGIEYSPVSLVKALYETGAKATKNTEVEINQIINDYAKGLTGSAIMLLGYVLASKGILRGGKEDNDDLLGEQEYSINIGNHSYTIDWAAPAALPLFVGTELFNTDTGETNIIDAIASLGEPVIEMSMMSGLENMLSSVANLAKGNSKLSGAVASLGAGYLSQGIPTLLGQVARSIDDTRRSTYTNLPSNTFAGTLEYQGRKAMNKIPLLSKQNEPYVDAWGETQENTGGSFVGRLAYNMLSPGYYSNTEQNALQSELSRLSDNVDVNVFPTTADKSFEGERLDNKTYTQLATEKGTLTTDNLNALISSDFYNSLDDNNKAEAVNTIKQFSNAYAKGEVLDYDIANSTSYKTLYNLYESNGIDGVIGYLEKKRDFDDFGISLGGKAANEWYEQNGREGLAEYSRIKETIEDAGLKYNDKTTSVYDQYGDTGLDILAEMKASNSNSGNAYIPVLEKYNMSDAEKGQFIADNASLTNAAKELINSNQYEALYHYYLARNNTVDYNGDGKVNTYDYYKYLYSIGVTGAEADSLVPVLKK